MALEKKSGDVLIETGLHLGKQVGFDWPQEGRSGTCVRWFREIAGEMATLDPLEEDRSPSPASRDWRLHSGGAFE